MKKISIIVCMLGSCMGLLSLNAQTTIKGSVFDQENKAPLSGVWIVDTVSQTYTTSDALGKFQIDLPDSVRTLVFSMVGYDKQYLNLQEAQENLEVELKPAILELDAVQITSRQTNSFESISKVDINLRPVQSSQDVLRVVPGLFIAQHAGGGKAEQIFLRGFDIDHGTDIQINVDGMPVNMVSHAHGQGYADLHFLIPELIDQVDFGKGPYYADHSNFTTAGYVDFQTLNQLDRSQLKLEAGQFNTLRGVGMFNLLGEKAREEGRNAYIASELMLTDGPFDSKQHFNRINLYGKYSHLMDDDQILTLQVSNFRSKWDHSGQIPIRAVESGQISRFGAIDDTEGGFTGRTNVSAKLIQGYDNGSIMENQVYYSRYDFELYSNFTFFLEDPEDGDQIRQREVRDIIGYNGKYSLFGNFGGGDLATTIGAGFRYDNVDDNELSRSKNRQETLERLAFGDVDETNMWIYVNESWQKGQFSMDLAARLDYFKFEYVDKLQENYQTQSEQKVFASPKVSLRYQVAPEAQVYVKSGIGFHSNDTRVVVARSGEEILPAAYGTDVGITFKPFRRLLVNAAVWGLILDQEFVYVGDAGIVEPSGKTRRIGADLSARWQLGSQWYLDADFNLTQPRAVDEPEGADYIPLAPTFSSIGGITWKARTGLNGSLRYRYLQDRPANEDNSLTAEGYFVIDALVNYTHDRFRIGIVIENLLDTEWREAQFETESRLLNEPEPVTEVHFTPGVPFFVRGNVSVFF